MQGDFPEQPIADSIKSNSPSLTPLLPSELSWRPPYLRRRVLGPFILILIIIALSQFSYRNDGLATSFPGLHYLWTYGPTVILALAAAAWARVTFQAKLIAPWICLHENPADVEEAFLLTICPCFRHWLSSDRSGAVIFLLRLLPRCPSSSVS